jgi:hypothetical protein
MTNTAAVRLLTERLASGLVHPGDPDNHQPAVALPLPGLSSTGIPPELAAQFAEEAGLPHSDAPKLLAEAIVALLETENTIIATVELSQIRAAAAAAPEGNRVVAVHCHCDNTLANPLLELTVTNSDRVTVNGGALLRALAARNPDCPHKAH